MVAVFDLNTDFFMFANSGSHLPWKSMNTIYLVEIFVFSQRIWNLVEFCNVCAKCRTMWMHWNISGSPDQPDRPVPPRAVKALGPGPRRRHQLRQSLRCPKWDQMGHLPLEASDIQIFAVGPVFISWRATSAKMVRRADFATSSTIHDWSWINSSGFCFKRCPNIIFLVFWAPACGWKLWKPGTSWNCHKCVSIFRRFWRLWMVRLSIWQRLTSPGIENPEAEIANIFIVFCARCQSQEFLVGQTRAWGSASR